MNAIAWREEIIGDARLILADCRDVLPTLDGVDVIITDPVWPNCPAGLIEGSLDPYGLFAEVCKILPSHKRAIFTMRCDSDPRFLAAYDWHTFLRIIAMPYVVPGYLGRILGGDEYAYWFGSPVVSAPGRRVIPGRTPPAQPNSRTPDGHPMSRAQVHFDWIVGWATDSGETTLDPFMGSGTTGVACAYHRKPFIGIEIEQKYFDIACFRIEQSYMQMSILDFAANDNRATEQMLLSL